MPYATLNNHCLFDRTKKEMKMEGKMEGNIEDNTQVGADVSYFE